MSMKLKDLLRFYASAMHEGNAALFIGSGMSRPAGFVDWTGLLAKCASEIGLNAEREEHDLAELAQFYLNSKRDRSDLNQALIDEFSKHGSSTVNHPILARLPVSTIWTTNYDVLIEEALRKRRKRVDVKSHDGDMAWRIPGRAAVLYKMHGDIGHPQELVICKDDYERYARTHPIFQNALEGDLVNKTFLFLGFSFKDPNLSHTLGHLRSLLQESKRTHYAVMRRARLNWDKESKEAHEEFEYETVKQNHQIENLKRYSIYTYLVDSYKDITKVLRGLEQEYAQRIIYLWVREGDKDQTMDLAKLGRKLGARLLGDEYKLYCELDTRLGRAVFDGAKSKSDEKYLDPLDRYLLRPMPMREDKAKLSRSQFASASRKAMIEKSGFVIFLGGNESDYSDIADDFAFAKARTVSIPVGSSGSAARNIWKRIGTDPVHFYGGAVSLETFKRLNDNDLDTVVDAIFDIIQRASSREPKHRPRFQISQSERRELYYNLKGKFPILPDKKLRRIVGDL